MRKKIASTVFFVLLSGAFAPAEARWAEKAEYPAVYELYQVEVHVDKDGKYRETTHLQTRVNNEAGKAAGNFRMVFNSANSDARVLHAGVWNEGKETAVPGRYIERKSIPANILGSDRLEQLVVSFQDVQVNSLLDLEYEVERKVPEIPDFYRFGFFPAFSGYIEKLDVKIFSELPLQFEKGDVRNLLKIQEEKKDEEFLYSLTNNAPLGFNTQEERDSYISPLEETYALFSSAPDYPTLARKIIPLIEAKYGHEPTPALSALLEKAKKIPGTVEQLNLITDWVIGEFRYLKDYRKEHSGDVPRDLEEILATRFGDCKDFSLITSYLLRRLGYRAHTAWVHRGNMDGFFSPRIAFDSFNHAIVYAEKDGKKFWIDPTNRVNFAQGIFPDIENRPALVLDPENPRVEQTASLEPGRNLFGLEARKELGGRTSDSRFSFAFRDAGALWITGQANQRSPREIKYSLLRSATEERNVISSEMESGDLKSRTVTDQSVRIKAKESVNPIKSSAGVGVALPSDPRIEKILGIAVQDRVTGLSLGTRWLAANRATYTGIRLVGKMPASCKVESPWLEAVRKVSRVGSSIVVEDSVANLKKEILAAEIQGRDFQRLRNELNDCFKDIYLVYRPLH
jgi:Domain of Unknown Function with PDB structure (DUF3857)/Transglutaminase-like superfamily